MQRRIPSRGRDRRLSVAVGLLYFSIASADASAEDCAPTLSAYLYAVEERVAWLGLGQAAPQLGSREEANRHWTQTELVLIRDACSRGKDVEAAWRIEQVEIRMDNDRARKAAKKASRTGASDPRTRAASGALVPRPGSRTGAPIALRVAASMPSARRTLPNGH